MAAKRTYGDPCGIARALDVVGERWAVLVVRELVLGPKRFTDLRVGLPNLSPDVLAQRLRDLGRAGVVRRRRLPPPAAAQVYELTEWGRELEPVVLALGRWGSRAPFPPAHGPLGVEALMVALRTLFDPLAAEGLSATYELRLGEHRFSARVTESRLELASGGSDDADAIVDSDPGTLSSVLWHGRRLAEARRTGAIKIEGNRRAVDRFLRLFPPPRPTLVGTSAVGTPD